MFKQQIILALVFGLNLAIVSAQNTVNQYDEDGNRHGLWTKNYQDTDQVRYKGVFKHGKEIDSFSYYKLLRGKSVLSAVRVFNEKDSLADVTFFASNQKVISKGKMNGKRFIGEWVYYHKNSKDKMIVENFNENGKLSGERNVYYENGVIAEITYYKDGKLTGEAKWFSDTNQLVKIANFKNGEFEGVYKTFDNEGKITSEGLYIKDKKKGTWIYREDGKEIIKNYQ